MKGLSAMSLFREAGGRGIFPEDLSFGMLCQDAGNGPDSPSGAIGWGGAGSFP